MAQPTPGDDVVHDLKACNKLLLNGRGVYSHDPEGRTLWLRGLQAPGGGGRCPDVVGPSGGFSLCSETIFKRERGKYVGFIELLWLRHFTLFGTWRREGITPFFVWKKWRTQMRKILDC